MTHPALLRTLLALGTIALPLQAGAVCAAYDDFTGAVQADAYEEALALYDSIDRDLTCDDALRKWGGTYLAGQTFRRATEIEGDPARQEELFRQALTFEEHWRTYDGLGKLAWDRGDYDAAAGYFQAAINRLVDGPQDHAASTEEIEEVYRLATASVGLASKAVEVPVTRSGKPGGIFAGHVRGFVVEEVALPITYRFGTSEFDEMGEVFAVKLLDHLTSIHAEKVLLSGHTDPVGGEEFNMKLSNDRASALADYLRQNGFAGEIETRGFGETHPPEPLPNIAPDSAEYYQLSRRVVFSLG